MNLVLSGKIFISLGDFFALQRVIADQRRKEALKLHSQQSAEASLAAIDARLVSSQDAGHTFSIAGSLDATAPKTDEKAETTILERPNSPSLVEQGQECRPGLLRSALKVALHTA